MSPPPPHPTRTRPDDRARLRFFVNLCRGIPRRKTRFYRRNTYVFSSDLNSVRRQSVESVFWYRLRRVLLLWPRTDLPSYTSPVNLPDGGLRCARRSKRTHILPAHQGEVTPLPEQSVQRPSAFPRRHDRGMSLATGFVRFQPRPMYPSSGVSDSPESLFASTFDPCVFERDSYGSTRRNIH